MLTMTDTAAAHLAELLVDAPEEAVVRFVPAQNGLAIQVAQTQPGDTTLTHGDKTILALDSMVNEALDGRTLDVQTTQQGPQLTLQ